MNKKAQEYINSKKKELEEIKSSDRESFLVEQELYEKVYAPDQFGIDHTEYPHCERNEKDGSSLYYKIIPISLTDKEYDEVYAAYKAVEDELDKEDREDDAKSTNGVAIFIMIVAVTIYIAGFVGGIVLGNNMRHYGFSWISASICWGVAFVCGSLFLGMSEVIKLLHSQNN